MTYLFDHELELKTVKVNQKAKNKGQRLFCSNVIVQIHTYTHIHTYQTDYSTGTTKLVKIKASSFCG